jgi:uncharacterized protein (TIGR00255 family)
MIQGMTGFGSAEHGAFRVEIRSVNHRFIDISVKLPQGLGQMEIPLRNRVKGQFFRGRFDITVSLAGEYDVKVRVNRGLAKEICNALGSLRDELSLSGTLGIDTISGFRELFISGVAAYDTESLFAAFEDALSMVKEMRLREGESVGRDMLARLDVLEAMNESIATLCPEAVQACREKYVGRLHELFREVHYDEHRILQEASIIAEKTDISEEITRFKAHLVQLKGTISSGDAVGRKIEFLLQELNREVNTIASKSADYGISAIAVEMKAELEKLREQAQNIQ